MQDVEYGAPNTVASHSRLFPPFRSEPPVGIKVENQRKVRVKSPSPIQVWRERAKTVTVSPCKKCGNSTMPKALSIRQPQNHLVSKGLCSNCATASEKLCAMSHYCMSETANHVHWGSGLCDTCYSLFPQCKVCARRLKVTEEHFRIGLCDGCYDSCGRSCHKCGENLTLGQMGWRTGMCDSCFDSNMKACQVCQHPIAPEELGWRTGFCDKCYAKEKGCKATVPLGRDLCQICSLHRKRECVRCDYIIPDDELRWSSGLCDACYKDTEKNCSVCRNKIPLRQLRWRSGVCDKCYTESPHKCQMCKADVDSKKLLCDQCCDALTSKSSKCSICRIVTIHVGDPFWSIGLCSHCYLDGVSRRQRQKRFSVDQIYETSDLAANGSAPLISLIYSDKATALAPNMQTARPAISHQVIFLLLGVSGWFTSNMVFAALPLFVEALPLGAELASICNMCTQAGAVFSMIYFSIEVKRREDSNMKMLKAETSRADGNARSDRLAKERTSLRRRQAEKKVLMQSILVTHAGQLLAVVTMFGFAFYWRFKQDVWAIVMLAALTGVVGNMADLTVWPISLQYPGCAIAIQVGGTVSGVLSNFLEGALRTYGISNLFAFAGLLQLLVWLPLFYITGRPKFSKGTTRWSKRGQCMCVGCDGCASRSIPDLPSKKISSSSAMTMSSTMSTSSTMSSLYMPLLAASSSVASEVSLQTRSIAQGGVDACTGFKQALALDSSGAASALKEDVYLQHICCLGTFVVKAFIYSLPSLFPYLVLPYGDVLTQQSIYQNVNTCYNVGNLVGRMLVQLYTVGKWTTMWTSLCICITFLFLMVSVFSQDIEAYLVPVLIAWWAIPTIVGILNLSAGLLSTGLMSEAFERACEKTCPPSMKNLPAAMGFYGQFGCVAGNLLVYLATSLHLI